MDTLNGANGNDLLQGDRCCSSFADVFNGGDGNDTASFRDHFAAVTVDIDGVADDGATGGSEGDNVQTTVENVTGGSGGDTITGNNANNTLSGLSGIDTLLGGGGGDSCIAAATLPPTQTTAGPRPIPSSPTRSTRSIRTARPEYRDDRSGLGPVADTG
jgi:RTX calcium-binding nonapeptide repeat (4 copies)